MRQQERKTHNESTRRQWVLAGHPRYTNSRLGGAGWPENAQLRCENTYRWLQFNNAVAELERDHHRSRKKRGPTEFLHQDRLPCRRGSQACRPKEEGRPQQASGADDKRLQASRMRLGSDNIPRIDEGKARENHPVRQDDARQDVEGDSEGQVDSTARGPSGVDQMAVTRARSDMRIFMR